VLRYFRARHVRSALLAVGLTVLTYGVLTRYDRLGVRYNGDNLCVKAA